MTDFNRRGFLGASLVAPVAAKEAIAHATGEAAHISGTMGISKMDLVKTRKALTEMPETPYISNESVLRQAVKLGLISEQTLIDKIKERHRGGINSRMVIDPDLEACKSFSAVTKMRMQHERNIEREFRQILEGFGNPVDRLSNMLRGKFLDSFVSTGESENEFSS